MNSAAAAAPATRPGDARDDAQAIAPAASAIDSTEIAIAEAPVRYERVHLHRQRVEQMRQRQPDGADLLPAGREAVEDAARDDQVRRARRSGSASGRAARNDARRQCPATPRRATTTRSPRSAGVRGRYSLHVLILWADVCRAGSQGFALALGGARPVHRRVPRFLVPLAPRDQRPPRRRAGDAAPVRACCCYAALPTAGSVVGCLVLFTHRRARAARRCSGSGFSGGTSSGAQDVHAEVRRAGAS